MTTIEKIKAEIEKLKTFYGELHTDFVCEKLLSFLDTLESEKPSEGLEEEISRYLREECSNDDEPSISDIARHFAQWQKEQDEILKVNYEGARTVYDNTVQHLQEKIDEKYELGKKDMKEQMLKEAVEGIAHPDDCEIWVNLVEYGYKFNDGDKVNVIIVKENEK